MSDVKYTGNGKHEAVLPPIAKTLLEAVGFTVEPIPVKADCSHCSGGGIMYYKSGLAAGYCAACGGKGWVIVTPVIPAYSEHGDLEREVCDHCRGTGEKQ